MSIITWGTQRVLLTFGGLWDLNANFNFTKVLCGSRVYTSTASVPSCAPAVPSECVTHREPAPDVSDEQESVVFEVAHHGVAPTQLRGPPISLVVVAYGAVTDHSQNIREDPLVIAEERDE